MDPFLAREIVETLSKGINPLTGRVLPAQDVCANEEVQEAILTVLEHCMIESSEQFLVRMKEEKLAKQRENRKNNAIKYPRNGEPWTKEEETQLLFLQKSGWSIYLIAKAFRRTPMAITNHLRRLQSTPVRRKL